MPSKKYINGRNKEYRILNKLKSEGYICARSAGSHSPIDVWAINPETKIIRLVQAKGKSMGKTATLRLFESLEHLEGFYVVKVEVVTSSRDI